MVADSGGLIHESGMWINDMLGFFEAEKRGMFFGMPQPLAKQPIKTLHDAYKVPGFRLRAGVESHEMETYAVAVLTLDRRAKKVCAAAAGKPVIACTTRDGSGCAIWGVRIGRCTWTFPCVASDARGAA